MTVALTDRFCKSVKAETQTDFFDTQVPGLALRVAPSGRKSWSLMYLRPETRKRARLTLGGYPEISLAAARAKAILEKARLAAGADPGAEKKAEAASTSVSDLVEAYATSVLSKQRSGADAARRLRLNVSQVIGSTKLSALHRRDLTRCLDKIMRRGAPGEAATTFRNARAMLRWAASRGDIDHAVIAGMRTPAVLAPRERFLTAEEIKATWIGLEGAAMATETRTTLKLCFVTGQRVGEVARASLAEFDLEGALWTIPAARSKNGKAHVVPLSPLAVDLVKGQLAHLEEERQRRARRYKAELAPPSGWLFPGPRGTPVDPHAVARALARLTVEVDENGEKKTTLFGIKPWTPHDLRRTVATHMEEAGVNPFVIAHVLNHVSVTRATVTSKVYARYTYEKEKREALELWAARLLEIIAGRSAG